MIVDRVPCAPDEPPFPPARSTSRTMSSSPPMLSAETSPRTPPPPVSAPDPPPARSDPPGPGPLPAAAAGGLDASRRVWLLGVEGAGMSAVAEILAARGLLAGGADRAPGPRAERLARVGVVVGTDDQPIPDDVDLVVASAAVPLAHPRLQEARRRGIATWKYARLLGALMSDRRGISIAGCHGKTTTTALVAWGLLHAGRDPSYVIGGSLSGVGSGARSGRGEHFVAEACEYDRSFLEHVPRVGVVLNVDLDHLDYYRDLAEIEEAFLSFAARVPREGVLIVGEAHGATFQSDPRVRAPVETHGTGAGATWRVLDAEPSASGHRQRFLLRRRDRRSVRLEVPLLGAHYALDAAAAAAALVAAGLDLEEVARAFQVFPGVGRRLERVADLCGVLVLDDYGHHPAEIRATLGALRGRYPGRRLVVVFQPHQASRTRRLLPEFATALAEADEVWLAPIYFARDTDEEQRSVSSADLASRIVEARGHATSFPDLQAVVKHGAKSVRPGDVVVTMGAGDVDEVSRGLADRLR